MNGDYTKWGIGHLSRLPNLPRWLTNKHSVHTGSDMSRCAQFFTSTVGVVPARKTCRTRIPPQAAAGICVQSDHELNRHGLLKWLAWLLLWGIASAPGVTAFAEQLTEEQIEFFEKHIRPVLVEHCYGCHSARAEPIRGGLRLDSRAGWLRGGDSGPAIVPGDVEASLLIQAVRYREDSVQMPPNGKLPQEKILLLERWVAMGAPDPRGEGTAEPTRAEVMAEMGRNHWAFRPPKRPQPPNMPDTLWARNALDQYLEVRWNQLGLQPAPEADRTVLIRRLYVDLMGVLPTYDEVLQFLNDPAADAYERLVDRLLASPHFGERWARHWLDVARYSDTKGYVFQEDRSYPQAYTYRDWVIETWNRDLPYDQFVRYQIAADQYPELEGLSVSSQAAMGFLTLGRRFLNNKHDIIDDRIDVLTRGILGLTVSCARCHDHKYDPISMRDYYALYGIFDSSVEPKDGLSTLRLVDSDRPHNARILLRGQPGNLGDEVPRRFIEVLCRGEPIPFQVGSGRRELADAVASADNPLTARVFVNRLWLHLFGEGLVSTPSDFGLRSEPPTQPEALDYLAERLIEHNWSIKAILREIVTSAAYRQSSHSSDEARRRDPQNRYFARQNRRRLDFEAMRDSILRATGDLDFRIGGPSVDITKAPFPYRRSVYAYIDRQNLPGWFRVFDFAGPDTHNPKRLETITPQQSLFLMNHPFVLEQCERLAGRLRQQYAYPSDSWVQAVYRQVLAREASDEEVQLAMEFLTGSTPPLAKETQSPWQYGYGYYQDGEGHRCTFQPLPHFDGQAWQGGPTLPDPVLGWVTLNARGGHPGDSMHIAIRRWIAPADGVVSVQGLLAHPAQQGDGVRGRVISSRLGKLGEWIAVHNQQQVVLNEIPVQAGDRLDFVVDCRDTIEHDSFQWTVRIAYRSPTDVALPEFHSAEQFRGPQAPPLDRSALLVQVLLMSNEFHFVD